MERPYQTAVSIMVHLPAPVKAGKYALNLRNAIINNNLDFYELKFNTK